MEIRFKQSSIISVVNSIHQGHADSSKGSTLVKTPNIETFKEILGKVVEGNEMAAVQIAEWQQFCKPATESEKKIVNKINLAAKSIFRY